jgi:hypothetical protein
MYLIGFSDVHLSCAGTCVGICGEEIALPLRRLRRGVVHFFGVAFTVFYCFFCMPLRRLRLGVIRALRCSVPYLR